jgi:hypothetical protein
MTDLTAYNVRTKTKVQILEPEVVTLGNGRMAVKGKASDDGRPVMRMVSAADAERIAESLKA